MREKKLFVFGKSESIPIQFFILSRKHFHVTTGGTYIYNMQKVGNQVVTYTNHEIRKLGKEQKLKSKLQRKYNNIVKFNVLVCTLLVCQGGT